ncbi:MAG: hypothetical protein RBT86_01995 [Azospira sp.]|jgi:hypothetical protein|nr:hypothetical protein [Azospira sp.]
MKFGPIRSPLALAFIGSLLLSLAAVAMNRGVLNRDGMLYVDVARIFMESGFSAAAQTFPWPFLSILIAFVSQGTGLGPETAGHVLNAIFLAGTCALLVACSMRLYPGAGWMVALTVLALPGLNDYRDQIIREYGYWFFVVLSLWLSLRWADAPDWRTGLWIQLAIIVAALFRTEALVFLPALLLWQLREAPARERRRRIAMLGLLPLLAALAMLLLLTSGNLPARLAVDLSRISPQRFSAVAGEIALALPPAARENAGTILFFGSLAIIPVKFVKMSGLFLVPLIYALRVLPGTHWRLFGWAFAAQLAVLAVFVTDMHFLAGRYVVALLLLAAPLIGCGFHALLQRYSRWKLPAVIILVLLATANAVSLSPTKQHFVAAGHWLAANAEDSPRTYNESARAAYYAGWRYRAVTATEATREALKQSIQRGEFDLVILEVPHQDVTFPDWLAGAGLREIERFAQTNGDMVVIAVPGTSSFPSSQ